MTQEERFFLNQNSFYTLIYYIFNVFNYDMDSNTDEIITKKYEINFVMHSQLKLSLRQLQVISTKPAGAVEALQQRRGE